MKRNLLKKCMIGIIMMSFLFVFVKLPSIQEVVARDLSGSTSWSGDELDFGVLKPVDYESVYRPFETIIDQANMADSNHVYVIEKATDLYHLSRLTLGEYKTLYLSLDYVLGNDINYYDAVLENMDYTFSPIGAIEPFTGTFDGQGFEITNLYFKSILDEDTYELTYPGLRFLSMFSVVSSGARIHDFGLINPIIIQPIEWGNMRYASYIAGENFGQIDHVYVVDSRLEASGMHVDGAFHLAGLVSLNKGVMSNMWIAAPYVRSRAVTHALSVEPILSENFGTIHQVYYDDTLYSEPANTLNGLGIETYQFQDHTYFSSEWFFNDAYHTLVEHSHEIDQVNGNQIYPTLHGLKVSNYQLIIRKPVDLIVMQELLLRSGYFRKSTFVIDRDLDMAAVSRDAYQAKKVSFNGHLTSKPIQVDHTLYHHQSIDGGAYGYYTIFNLSLNHIENLFAYDTVGLFNILFGDVTNLNFRNVSLTLAKSKIKSDTVKIGIIAGDMIGGTISNVHIDGEISFTGDSKPLVTMMAGGFVGEARGSIQRSSITGIFEGSELFQQDDLKIYQGGLVGYGTSLDINQIISDVDLLGFHSTVLRDQSLSLGGVIGYAFDSSLNQVMYSGDMSYVPLIPTSIKLSIGGLFGLAEGKLTVEQVNQKGVMQIKAQTYSNLEFSGLGNINQANFIGKRMLHSGSMMLNTTGLVFTEAERFQQNINLTQGFNIVNSSGNIEGLFNQSSITFDGAYVDTFASLINGKEILDLNLFHLENKGHVTINTSTLLTHDHPTYSLMVIGKHTNLEHLRNTGHMEVNLSHPYAVNYLANSFEVVGIIDHLSDGYVAKDLFQGGNLSLKTLGSTSLDTNLLIAGMVLYHQNKSYSVERGVDPVSIDFKHMDGAMHNVLNTGDLTIQGSFAKHVYASGIAFQQEGLLTGAFNLGDIKISNLNQSNTSHAAASGITSLLIGAYATVMDSANRGQIEVNQMSPQAYAHASGIVIRNDLRSDLSMAQPSDQHHLSKIAFSINYGDVYAWSETDESSHTISMESKVKSAGVLSMGVLSVVNNVNYGHIYSKYTAAGFIGLIPLNHFGTLNQNEVYMSNLIQYGKVRALTSYDWIDKTYDELTNLPTRTAYFAFGAMVGKIHTGTQSWAFAGNVTYPIDRIYFGYLINMDEKINMFDNAPELSSSWADGFGNLQEANEVILNMLAYMGTSKPTDQSKPPFTYFYQGGWIGQYMGKVIDYYTISDEEGGFFHESFPFRSTRPIYSGTDQYIHDYIAFIDKDHANPVLIEQLELSTGKTFPGLYALSSSEGINEGIFMPDNLDVESLSPFDSALLVRDQSWLGQADDQESIAYALYAQMRQTRASFAATIYDLELSQTDANGLLVQNGLNLNSPVIDETRKMITYYLPSNAAILNQTSSSLMNVYRFIEVSDGLGRKVPDIVTSGSQTYSWIGDYKKSGDHFVEIGPYHTTGTVMLSTSDLEVVTSYARSTPVYSQDFMESDATMTSLFKHIPHTYILFWWQATGYRVSATTGFQAGYGAYEPYTLSGYPTLYRYVGPSKENVTYIKTDVEENVTVFNDAQIYFGVDPNSSNHVISKGASLTHQGLSQQEVASVPRSYGVYEAMYDENGFYIDSVQDHYGKIRVFSESYDPLDPASYQDYDIRIIRTANQSITAIHQLTVSSFNGLPVDPNVFYTTSTQSMQAIDPYQKGVVEISYETMNVADLESLSSRITVVDAQTDVFIDHDLYQVKQGVNQTLSTFDNKTGTWGTGQTSFSIEFNELIPSGAYEIKFELITGDIYIVYFEKLESHLAQVQSITYQGQTMDVTGSTLISEIPYGLFYDPNLEDTKPVDFSNLSSIHEVYFSDLLITLPSYLEGIEISSFSSISFVSLTIDMVDTLRHRYQIVYEVVAEDLTTSSFTHILIEEMPNLSPISIYDNGSRVTGYTHDISYNAAPTFRVVYDLSNVFIHTDSPWQIVSMFTPLHELEEAFLGSDYVLSVIPEMGYEVDLIKETPMGSYQVMFSYHQEMVLWGQTLTWHFEYPTMTFNKLMNDESMLKDILFVSDAVFQGFNTIIDTSLITSERYQYLLQHPSEREVILLPTTGIIYQDHANQPVYYIIGQVQQTHLSYYVPQMMIPDGAIIKRVTDDINIGPEYQSDLLYADYSPLGDQFNFIQYRIYAMDYEINPTHYTDFYIAVQDMTNMIRFDVSINNQASIPVETVHIRISICQTEVGNETCARENEILSMGIFSSYQNGIYSHPVFQTTTYGTYKVEVFLPDGYGYTISVSEVIIIGNAFYVENSIFPRKVYMTLTITDQIIEKTWGIEHHQLLEPTN